jgi:hypothetical protein
MEPVFADHSLTLDDPAKQYDERMRPTTFDDLLRWFAIVVWVGIAGLIIFVCVILFLYQPP